MTNSGQISVDILYNSKFNNVDYPDSWNTLISSADKVTAFKAVYLLQDFILPQIQIETTFEDIKNADYCCLNNSTSGVVGDGEYYRIKNIEMVNKNCATLYLELDPFSTIGIDNINIVSGWLTRCTPLTDGIFTNIISEPYTPLDPVEYDIYTVDVGNTYRKLIVSSVNLADIGLTVRRLQTDTASLTVPIVNTSPYTTRYTLQLPGDSFNKFANHTTVYDYDEIDPSTFQALQSVNLSESIVGSYEIPEKFIDWSNSVFTGKYFKIIWGKTFEVDSNQPYIYGATKNNKVYSINNMYIVNSLASGSTNVYNAYELYKIGDSSPKWNLYADLSNVGRPYISPKILNNVNLNGVNALLSVTEGSSWQNYPLLFEGGAGYAFTNMLATMTSQLIGNNYKYLNTAQGLNNQFRNDSIAYNDERYAANYGFILEERKAYRDAEAARRYYASENWAPNSLFDAIAKGALSATNYIGGAIGGSDATNTVSAAYDMLQYNETMQQIKSQSQAYNLLANANYGNIQANYKADLSNANLQYVVNNAVINARKEILGYNVQGHATPPTIAYPRNNGLQAYTGNTFQIIHQKLTVRDQQRFDEFLTRFGYATSELFTNEHLKSAPIFNYIQASEVLIEDKRKNYPRYVIELAENLFKAGVRLWHVDRKQYRNYSLIDNRGYKYEKSNKEI